MFKCIAEYLKDIAAGLVEDDTPSSRDIKEKRKVIKDPTETTQAESEIKTAPIPRVQPDVQERDKKDSKRPYIKPPRRLQDFKSEWKGEGSREKRKEYQQQYRSENGSGYFKKTVK